VPNLCFVCFLDADSKMDVNKRMRLAKALATQGKTTSKGVDDGRGPSTSPHESPPKGRFGPTLELWPR